MPKTILERIAAGESPAVEECLETYRGLVWSIARKLCPNHADAEDAVQEVFIEVWRHAARFDRQRASETTFITTIARRRMIDRLRRRGRELDTAPVEEEMVESVSRHEEEAELREEVARAKQYLRQLRPEQQQVLEMSLTQGLSQSQISEATDLPLGTVKTHARRGLLRLRELLDADPTGTTREDNSTLQARRLE